MALNESLQYRWLVENHVRLVIVKDNLTTAALHANDIETVALMDKLPHPLHLVVDMRDLRSFPPLNEILNLRYLRHARMGWLLTIGAAHNPLTRFFLNAVGRITHVAYKDFDQLEDVASFLERYDASLKCDLVIL